MLLWAAALSSCMVSHSHQASNQSDNCKASIRSNPFVFIALLMSLLAAITLSGCVGLTSVKTGSADAATHAALAASPSSMNFGNVQVGSTSTLSLTLTNSATTAITALRATVSGTGFKIKTSALPLSLA